MIWAVVLWPCAAGLLVWLGGSDPSSDGQGRAPLAAAGVLALVVTAFLAVYAAWVEASGSLHWSSVLQPTLSSTRIAGLIAVLVPVVAAPVVLYAGFAEETRGLTRLTGLLVIFVGAMELTVLADDLLALLFGWELMSAISWGLIAHHWGSFGKAQAAAHAFNTTKLGSIGLFVAAGAALASVGSLEYSQLPDATGTLRTLLVAGVLVAALTKSAQMPFSPWLYSAMAGPAPVSALLHSATMVAAGVYVLVRLHPVLVLEAWFAPTAIAFGLLTALAGGVAAALQPHIKKTLAASTSAQYGLMFVAVGAGYPAAAIAHLVMHAVVKAQLFLCGGTAIAAAGTEELRLMRLGRALPGVAKLSLLGALALAAVPPLGAAWSKEMVAAAAGHRSAWLVAGVAGAGALTALYAFRFQLLAFGKSDRRALRRPSRPALTAMGSLAVLAVASSALWFTDVSARASGWIRLPLPSGQPWEPAVSLLAVAAGGYAAWAFDRSGRLERLGVARVDALADWFRIPAAVRLTVVTPTLRLAAGAAEFDRAVVDRGAELAARAGRLGSGLATRLGETTVDGAVETLAAAGTRVARWLSVTAEGLVDRSVEGLARATGVAAGDARKLQTGMLHHYYLTVVAGLAGLVLGAAVFR